MAVPTPQQRYRATPKGQAYSLQQSRRRGAQRRHFLVGVKLGCGCVDCGYAAHPDALQFDHVRGEKVSGVGNLRGWKSILAELEKCDVVCANCHAIRSAAAARSRLIT